MNIFVQPYIQGTQATVTCQLYDPRDVRNSRVRFRRDSIPLLERANSMYVPSGRWPALGYILLARSDYNSLNQYSNQFELNIGDTTNPNNVGTLGKLSIISARCVTRGLASDPNAIYLVELTDDRGILHNRWFQAPITTFYNIRSPAYPQLYHTPSLNSGTPWTWSTMLQDIWTRLNTFGGGTVLGPWPGLPSAPAGTPEGWWFLGVSGWYALCNVLDYLGMTVACDLTNANPYTIVSLGAADAAFSALQTRYAGNLEDDLEYIDVGAARVPLTVDVLFRRRNQYYGTEETIRRDALQWQMTPHYAVTVNAPAQFTGKAIGKHSLWSDFTVQYDIDNTPLDSDTATAATIAAERVTQYFDRIYQQTQGHMSQVYAGALPFATGSLVDGVRWYQDYSNQKRQGWKTNIVRGPCPPWPDVWETD